MSKGQADRGPPDGDFELSDFATDEVTGIRAYTFSDRVKEKVQFLGLTGYADRPQLTEEHNGVFSDLKEGDYFNGRLPIVIRRLSLDQISALYSLFTNWFSYLTFQNNMIAAERSEALKQKEFLWSHVRKQYKYYVDIDGKTKKRTDQQMSDMARVDYRFVQANARYTEINTLYEIMLATLEVADQDMKMMSREVTIVQTKLEYEAKGGGFKGRAGRPWGPKTGGSDASKSTPPSSPRQPIRPRVHGTNR